MRFAIHHKAIVARFFILGHVSVVLNAKCPGAVRSVWGAENLADIIIWSADTSRWRRGA